MPPPTAQNTARTQPGMRRATGNDPNRPSADRTEPTMPIPSLGERPRGGGLWGSLRAGTRTALAAISAVVLLVTGYAWMALSDLGQGLSTSGVTAGAGPDGATDILLVGKDSRTDAQGNPLPEEVLQRLRAGDNEASLTDTLILLHIPQDRSRAVAYSLPRDSYVSIPGYGHHKINSAFGRAQSAAAEHLRDQGMSDPAAVERQSAEAGRETLVDTVGELTGVGIDHYAEVNLLGFYQITQAVGGVPVCLQDAVNDPYSGADFPAGRQTVSGGDALAFVRQRHGLPRGDLDRVARQQAFLAGLARSMLSTGVLANPAKLDHLFDALQQSVVLDQGWDVLTFAQQMHGLAAGNLAFDTIPIEDPAYDTPDGEALKIDPGEVQSTIHRANQGLPATPPTPPGLDEATVGVRNATDTSGLASRVRNDLAEEDIPVGTARNGKPRTTSRVAFAPGEGEVARYVAGELDGLPIHRDRSLDPGEVRVRLADDYDGPGHSTQHGFAPPRLVQLDGAQQQAAPPPSDDAITADGIPCIN